MFKMITNRGSGRTYNTCKYALIHKCNIIVPSFSTMKYALKCLQTLYNGSYSYKDPKIAQSGYASVSVHDNDENLDFDIYIYSAKYVKNHQYDISSSKRPIVVDDIDMCFREILDINDFQGFTLGFDEFDFKKGTE